MSAPAAALVRRPARLRVGERSLDAAGITDAGLRADFQECRRLHAEHGRTYYLATALLPPAKRPWVWALYGFARYADEFVDSLTAPDPAALVRFEEEFWRGLDGATATAGPTGADARDGGTAPDAVSRAMALTMDRWGIPREHVRAFLASMRMDITETGYATWGDLVGYMHGSAAVIGLQMLPVLEPLPGMEQDAARCARTLGEAFQMSNFVRDVGEDLERGRVYLPQEDLDACGVDRDELWHCRRSRSLTPGVRTLLELEVARTRELYARARPGVGMLAPSSRDAIACADELYGGILGAVEDADLRVLHRRVSVPVPRRLRVALPALARARRARADERAWRTV